ncbi:hypothetical protein SFIMM107S_07353 [Streptomyces griseus]
MAMTSPSGVKPMTVIRWPEVPYPAPVSSSFRKDWEVMTGIPARISRSTSVSEPSRVTAAFMSRYVAA